MESEVVKSQLNSPVATPTAAKDELADFDSFVSPGQRAAVHPRMRALQGDSNKSEIVLTPRSNRLFSKVSEASGCSADSEGRRGSGRRRGS